MVTGTPKPYPLLRGGGKFGYPAAVLASEHEFAGLLLNWFRQHARDLPWRGTGDPYAIWVSEIMLQQTQVRTVIPYFERWMRALPDVQALAEATPEKLHKLWEGLGYYTRVRNMLRAAKLICEQFHGRFPNSFDQVLDLPGIGRYTAGAICSIAFGQPTPVLDGNVIRVLTRVHCLKGNPHDKNVNSRLWALASDLVRAALIRDSSPSLALNRKTRFVSGPSALNQALMELGAVVCTPKDPQCVQCPLNDLCRARRRHCVLKYPQLAKRNPATPRQFLAFVVQHRDCLLVRQRPPGVVNAHLWEFPNLEVTTRTVKLDECARLALGVTVGKIRQLCVIRHSITRYRIKLEAFHTVLKRDRARLSVSAGEWMPRHKIRELAFASAHKRVLEQWSRAQASQQ